MSRDGEGRRRRRRGSSVSEDFNYINCCSLCILVGFLLCLTDMNRKTRSILTWFWVVSLSLTIGLLISLKVYQTQTITLYPSDNRKVSGISTTFCNGVALRATTPVDSYLLPTEPEISTSSPEKSNLTKTFNIHSNHYVYWNFNLLKGSNLSILTCATNTPDVCVLKGQKSYEHWLKRQYDWSECVTHRYVFECVRYKPTRISISIAETDDYYIIFSNTDQTYVSQAGMRVDIERAVYSVSSAAVTCFKSPECYFEFGLSYPESVVIRVPSTAPEQSTLTVICVDRAWVYVCLFGLLSGFIGIFLTVLIYRFCKKGTAGEDGDGDSNVDDIWTTSVSYRASRRQANENNGRDNVAFQDPPPSYEEAMGL